MLILSKKGGVRVRRYSAAISIVLTFIGLSPLLNFYSVMAEYFIQILTVCMFISFLFALYAEKNVWRKVALWFLGVVFLVLILFFLAMTILWNKP